MSAINSYIVACMCVLISYAAAGQQNKPAKKDSSYVPKAIGGTKKSFSAGAKPGEDDEIDASKGEAKDVFEMGFWGMARDEYEVLLKDKRDHPKFNYRVGVCYIEGNIGPKKKAIRYLERAIKTGHAPKDAMYQLGRAYHLSYNFDKAVETFNTFIASSKDEELIFMAHRSIDCCAAAKELMKYPLNVQIENMGPGVNSEFADYYPFVDADQHYVIFTSRRYKLNRGIEMMDGSRTADIFIVYDKKGDWTKAKNIGMLNSAFEEEIVGLTRNGERIFLSVDSWETSGDLHISKKRGKQFQKAFTLGPNVNSPFAELTACATKDEQLLYFSSDRKGGYGGFDIYVSRRLPTLEWGPAVNLGPTINTEFDEFFPTLSDDEKMLTFSSQGHISMGGFDLFSSKLKPDSTWAEPHNLGYPLNTPENEMQISYVRNGRTAFFAAFREGGFGELDIYKATFTKVEDNATAIRGVVRTLVPIDYADYAAFDKYTNGKVVRKFPIDFKPPIGSNWNFKEKVKVIVKPGYVYKTYVQMEKSGEKKKYRFDKAPLDKPGYKFIDLQTKLMPIKGYKKPAANRRKFVERTIDDVSIMVTDDASGDLKGTYRVTPNGHFIMILTPGTYIIEAEVAGDIAYTKKIRVLGKGSFKEEVKRNIIIAAAESVQPIHYSELTEADLKPKKKKKKRRY